VSTHPKGHLRLRLLLAAWVLLASLGSGLLAGDPARAHAGEDHGNDAAAQPAASLTVAPRATARSEDFELVAVLEGEAAPGRRLRVSLDRFDSNEPVVGARIEIEVDGQAAQASEDSPGSYLVRLAAIDRAAPGSTLPLTISIDAGQTADLLTATLEIPAQAIRSADHAHAWTEVGTWVTSAVIALAGLALLGLRRRRQRRV
jgi:MYXO-CTERM domain-containing protein